MVACTLHFLSSTIVLRRYKSASRLTRNATCRLSEKKGPSIQIMFKVLFCGPMCHRRLGDLCRSHSVSELDVTLKISTRGPSRVESSIIVCVRWGIYDINYHKKRTWPGRLRGPARCDSRNHGWIASSGDCIDVMVLDRLFGKGLRSRNRDISLEPLYGARCAFSTEGAVEATVPSICLITSIEFQDENDAF